MMASCHFTLLLACSYICGGTNKLEVSKCKHSRHTQLMMIGSLDDMYIFITFALLAGRFPSSPNKHCGILPSQHTIYYLASFFRLIIIFQKCRNFEKKCSFPRFFFSVKENIELSGTIFEAKSSKLINYLANMC
jgi:hypothetical protein